MLNQQLSTVGRHGFWTNCLGLAALTLPTRLHLRHAVHYVQSAILHSKRRVSSQPVAQSEPRAPPEPRVSSAYRRWTQSEHDKLEALLARGVDPRAISATLDRTLGSVTRMAYLARHGHHIPATRPWHGEDAALVRQLHIDGKSLSEMHAMMPHRTRSFITAYRYRNLQGLHKHYSGWSSDDDQLLSDIKARGLSWAQIEPHIKSAFPQRTFAAVQKHWSVLRRRRREAARQSGNTNS